MPTSPTENSTITVLKRIEARISDPSRWCQQTMARGCDGAPVDVEGDSVAQVCLNGAVTLDSSGLPDEAEAAIRKAIRHSAAVLYQRDCASLNDILGHDAVMNVVRRAIELAENGGAS